MLKKASDPYKALLDYRNTKIPDIGLSPAQIFFGRRLRTLLPTTAPLLNAHNRQDIRKKLKEMQEKQKHYYDQHSKPLEPLENEQKVLIHNGEKCAKYATVQRQHHTPRSYIHVVRTDDGNFIVETEDICDLQMLINNMNRRNTKSGIKCIIIIRNKRQLTHMKVEWKKLSTVHRSRSQSLQGQEGLYKCR